ncbi:MAG: MFS transporter, partial [Deltaproteobacteria bacterium]|nr:MFS transporter [Deltaproteobacteria bacterium]
SLQEIFGWTKSDLGIFETMLPLVYGLSVVFNAPLADKIGGRKAFLIGAVGVVIFNIAFGAFYMVVIEPAQWLTKGDTQEMVQAAQLSGGLGARSMAWIMATIWALNGYFQSFGALSIVKINAQWFHLRERGTFGAIFGVLIRFGLILSFSGAPLIVAYLPWQWAFWIPAGFVALLFFLNLVFVVDTPEEAGFSEKDTGDATLGEKGQTITTRMILAKILTSRTMWMIGVASMMIGMVRRSVVDAWFPVYFNEVHHVARTDWMYQLVAWGIALLGIAGGFAFGIMSDRVYKGRRAPAVVFGFTGMAVMLVLFYFSDTLELGAWGALTCIVLLSFFVNGAHGMVGGAASMDFGGRKAAATAAGLIDGMQYLAAAVTGVVVGEITTTYGWQAWKLWPIPFAVIGALVMLKLWNVVPKGRGGH